MKQNNCVDIYRDYFEYDDDNTNEREDQLKIVSEYPDPVGKRPVSGVSWSPDGGTSIAITYCSPEFLGQSLETLPIARTFKHNIFSSSDDQRVQRLHL